MRWTMLLAALTASALTGSRSIDAQTPTDPVATHRATYQVIERSLPSYRHAEASMDTLGLEERSTEGGTVTAYCDGAVIRLLMAEYDGETGNTTHRFYFDHDSVFFVFSQSARGIPNGRDPYPRRTIFEDERFYFTNERLIRWLGPKNKPKSVSSHDATEQASRLLEDARRLSAVMPACHPKYAPP